jgi:hypothetical protein
MIEHNKSEIHHNQEARRGQEGGFTYIDVMMAIGVMTIGMLGLLMTMTTAMVATSQGQYEVVAKQFATSTMESIFSARDINNPNITSFAAIANQANGGIFVNGYNPVYVLNTNAAGQVVPATGPDGIMGTTDDNQPVNSTSPTPQAYPLFSRQIAITSIGTDSNGNTNLIKIVVTIKYQVNNLTLTQSMTSYMANYNTQSV